MSVRLMTSAGHGRTPRPDVLGPGLLLMAGLGLLIAGWVGASGRAQVEGQIPYLNLAVGGVVLVGAACGAYLQSLRRIVAGRTQSVAGAALVVIEDKGIRRV